MKAMINLDREATLEILKSLNVDIKPEIVDNYKKLVEREVEHFCKNELHNALEKYVKDYVMSKMLKEATKTLKNKIDNEQDKIIYTEVSKCHKQYLDNVKDLYAENVTRLKSSVEKVDIETIVKDQIDKSVREYLDRKFK